LLVAGFWLLVSGCWFLAVGFLLLVAGFWKKFSQSPKGMPLAETLVNLVN
jgi:hypothetical protein